MMLALDPAQTHEARLREDPDAVFVFRFLTGREYIGALEVDARRKASEPLDPEVTLAVYEALRVNLVGWHHLTARRTPGGEPAPVEYDPARLEDVTTAAEAWELFYQSIAQGRLSVPEKKGSGSPSASSGDSPAGDAAPADAATE